jgi:hypothetical protein
MPSKSPKQHRLMEAVAHGMKPKAGGPSKAVAQEFVAADKAKRPSGQYAGKRESAGKANGGGLGEPMHPQSHDDFEKLGHS